MTCFSKAMHNVSLTRDWEGIFVLCRVYVHRDLLKSEWYGSRCLLIVLSCVLSHEINKWVL